MGYGVGWGVEVGRLHRTSPSSARRWRRTVSTACTACSTGLPAPSTSTHAASSCVQTSLRAATSSSPPPSSQATLASSCSESSPTCPPTAGGCAGAGSGPGWAGRGPQQAGLAPEAQRCAASAPGVEPRLQPFQADASTRLLPLPSPALLFQPLLAM